MLIFSWRLKVLSGQVRESWKRGKRPERGIKSHVSNFLKHGSLIPPSCVIQQDKFLYGSGVPSSFQKEGTDSSMSNLRPSSQTWKCVLGWGREWKGVRGSIETSLAPGILEVIKR
jgi:hypothetical protein